MNEIDINNRMAIDFQTNENATLDIIKNERSSINLLKIYENNKDYINSAKLILSQLLSIANSNLSIIDKGKIAYSWIKRLEENPKIVKEANVIIGPPINWLKNGSSNILSVFNMRRDMSSLDATQWGKGKEFATKYGILPKAGENTTKIITDSYQKLCENMNRAQSLQLRLNIGGLNVAWDSSSFSSGFDKLVQQYASSPTSIYGFVKGAATAYNNAGDFKIYEILDLYSSTLGGSNEYSNTISIWLMNFILKILPPPINLIFLLSIYDKINPYFKEELKIENICIKQKSQYIDNYSTSNNQTTYFCDFRGTPISNKNSTNENILI